VPELAAISAKIGAFVVIASGAKRGRDGSLSADMILHQNGRVDAVLVADRATINTAEGRQTWARGATAGAPPGSRPSAEELDALIRDRILPEAFKLLQEAPGKPTQADQLVQMVQQVAGDFAADVATEAELFHAPDQKAYATVVIDGRRETHPLRSGAFRFWMARKFFETRGKTPSSQALTDAANVLAGIALFQGPEHRVFTRIAEADGAVYLDLANEARQAVAIGPNGWWVADRPPVRFRRAKGMLPLPVPTRGGSIEPLRQYVNLPTDDADATWRLVVGWLVGAFRPAGPYAILAVHGQQGSAKSTLARILRSLVDPNEAAIRSTPRDDRDLMIAATNAWMLAFDNVSHLPDWLSDAYCRVATGGGFATRQLYEDAEEVIFTAQRPITLNGITELATRPDLLDRSIVVYLPTIDEAKRRNERDLWAAFDRARPAILGAVLDAVSAAQKHEATTVLARRPRMADFATWVTAAETGLNWDQGAFLAAYTANRADANDLALEASAVSQAVMEFAANLTAPWEGTATELLKLFNGRVEEVTRKQKGWPADGRALSNTLRRLAPNLRAAGVGVTFLPRSGRRRLIHIEQEGEPASPSSSASSSGENSDSRAGFRGDDGGDDDEVVTMDDARGDTGSGSPSSGNPASQQAFWADGDADDDGDDEMRSHSDDEVIL
jgi:hypothetical protein